MNDGLALSDLEVEILDCLIDGDYALPHLCELLARQEFERRKALDCLASLHARGFIQFHERSDLFGLEDISYIDPNCGEADILRLIESKVAEPKFALDLTELGLSSINGHIRSLRNSPNGSEST